MYIKKLTGEQVSYLFDEVTELCIVLLYSLFAAVGLYQQLHGVRLGLICTLLGLPHLDHKENEETAHLYLELFVVKFHSPSQRACPPPASPLRSPDRGLWLI